MAKIRQRKTKKKGKAKQMSTYRKPVTLIFAYDMSDSPPGKFFVGLIRTKTDLLGRTYKIFRQEHPHLEKCKACDLKWSDLLKVLKFLNHHGVRMSTTCFNSHQWADFKRRFSNFKDFKEKTIAYVYYRLLTRSQNVYRHLNYPLVTCQEKHTDMKKVHKYMLALSKADKYSFDISSGSGTTNKAVKIADYVAQSLKKLKVHKLSELKNLKCVKIDNDKRLLSKLFE